LSQYEIHVRIKLLESDYKGQIAAVVLPSTFTKEDLSKTLDYITLMLKNVEIQIWDSKEGKWVT